MEPSDARVLSSQSLRAAVIGDQSSDRWILKIEIEADNRRAMESLTALSNGRFGTRGLFPGSVGQTVGNGIFDGDPVPGLLIGPCWTGVEFGMVHSLGAELDLRYGVLRTRFLHSRSGHQLEMLQFVSIARSTVHGLRVEGSAVAFDCASALSAPAAQSGVVVEVQADATSNLATLSAASYRGTMVAAVTQDCVDDDDGVRRLTRMASFEALAGTSDASELVATAQVELAAARKLGFDQLLAEHNAAWERRWDDAAIDLPEVPDLEQAIRFSQFHLLSSSSSLQSSMWSSQGPPESAIGARGLTGLAYKGHVFWDTDIFVVPALAAMAPSLARSALLYRWRRLLAARQRAADEGLAGARFPWESADTGLEAAPTQGLDLHGETVPIRTGQMEEHIVADIAWAASNYFDWTGDRRFLGTVGSEILVETARYWQSRVELDSGVGHIRHVIGPDEYHEDVDDNAFTNVMARWNLVAAADLCRQLDLDLGSEPETWLRTANSLVDGFDHEYGRHEQFAGFFQLDPVPASSLGQPPISADALLGRHRIQQVQIIKQADVLMLHHLLPDQLPVGSLSTDIDYYLPRTAHGSSLSPAITAAVLARAGHTAEAIQWFAMAARFDLHDLSGTTAGGLHLATMGGVWQAFVQGFLGVRPTSMGLVVDPHVPVEWGTAVVRFRFQFASVHLEASNDSLALTSSSPIEIVLGQITLRSVTELRARRSATGWEVR